MTKKIARKGKAADRRTLRVSAIEARLRQKLPAEDAAALRSFLLGDALTGPAQRGVEKVAAGQLTEQLAYVDPSRLFATGLFNAYNPSLLVTRKGLDIFDQMKLDEQVKMALSFKKLACIAPGWEIASPGDQDEKWEVTEFVRDNLTHFEGGWSQALKKIMRALEYGFSVAEKIYATPQEAPPWAPGKLTLKKLNEVKPHFLDFEQDMFGETLSIIQRWTPGHPTTIPERRFPPEKFVHYAFDMQHENPYGHSDLEAAYRPWWVKDNAYKWFAVLLERYGLPPFFLFYDPQDYQGNQVEALKKIVKNIQNATMGLLPRAKKEGLEFWQQAVSATSKDVFLAALGRFDIDIAKAVLMPSHIGGTSETKDQGSGGSMARSQVHFKMFMFVISELQKEVAQVINSQIVKQLCDLNFAGLKSYPEFRFNSVDDEVETKIFELWESLVTGKIVNRTEDDETYIRSALGMPKNESPVLEPLPSDAMLDAKAEADAAKKKEGGKAVPFEDQSEEMRSFAADNGCTWRMVGGHPVCIRGGGEGGGGSRPPELGVKGDKILLGGGSVTSVAEDSWIVFDAKYEGEPMTLKLTKAKGGYLIDIDNRSDHFEKTLKGAVDYLNKYGSVYAGVDRRDE